MKKRFIGKLTYRQKWTCPLCGVKNSLIRRLSSRGKMIPTYCYGRNGEGCRKKPKVKA